MKNFLLVLQFLTIFPVPVKTPVQKEDFGKCLLYFPLAGLVIGIILALTSHILSFMPALVKSAAILATSAVITGAIHLDGFADSCDGFYAGANKDKTLEIMRDSHIGTIAVVSLALLLLLKFSLIASMPDDLLVKALILTAVFSRWAQSLACISGVYARQEGKAKYFVEFADKKDIFIGAAFTLCLFILLMGIKGCVLFFISTASIFLFLRYANSRIGGVTGDTIGATNEIAEVLSLFCFVAAYYL